MDFNMMSLLLWLDKVAIISFGFIGGVSRYKCIYVFRCDK